jgi:hypothetical protein
MGGPWARAGVEGHAAVEAWPSSDFSHRLQAHRIATSVTGRYLRRRMKHFQSWRCAQVERASVGHSQRLRSLELHLSGPLALAQPTSPAPSFPSGRPKLTG